MDYCSGIFYRVIKTNKVKKHGGLNISGAVLTLISAFSLYYIYEGENY